MQYLLYIYVHIQIDVCAFICLYIVDATFDVFHILNLDKTIQLY